MDLLRPSLRRRGLALVGAASLALVVAGCSGSAVGPSPAATVNGADISADDVEELVAANKAFYEQAIENGLDTNGELAAALEETQGVAPGTVGRQGASDALNSLIVTEVLHQELEELDALPDESLEDEVRAELETQAGGAEALAEYDEDFIDFTVRTDALQRAYRDVLAAEQTADIEPLSDEEREARILELYESVKAERPLCLNIILVTAEADAQAALERIRGGEAFDDVAAEVTIAPPSTTDGGYLYCSDYEQVTAAFGADLQGTPVGELVGPFSADDGTGQVQYVVAEVAGTDGPSLDDVREGLESTIDAETVVDPSQVDISAGLLGLLDDADIEIDPRYGTWNPETYDIDPPVAPEDPGTTTTTVPAFDTVPALEE